MSIRLAGPLPITEITAVFGGTTPHALSEYYANGSFLITGWAPKIPPVPNKGSSLPMSVFYGKGKKIPITITIAANETNVDVFSKFKTAVANYANVDISATLIINSGVTVYGSNAAALTLNGRDATRATGFKPTDDVVIVNNGNIVGYPGLGGSGGIGTTTLPVQGGTGGTAIVLQSTAKIENYGIIAGGANGGVGGAGGLTQVTGQTYCTQYYTTQNKQCNLGPCGSGARIVTRMSQYCNSGPCQQGDQRCQGYDRGDRCQCETKGQQCTQQSQVRAMGAGPCNPPRYTTSYTNTTGGKGGNGATVFSNTVISGSPGGGGDAPAASAGQNGGTWGGGLWISGRGFLILSTAIGGTVFGGFN